MKSILDKKVIYDTYVCKMELLSYYEKTDTKESPPSHDSSKSKDLGQAFRVLNTTRIVFLSH